MLPFLWALACTESPDTIISTCEPTSPLTQDATDALGFSLDDALERLPPSVDAVISRWDSDGVSPERSVRDHIAVTLQIDRANATFADDVSCPGFSPMMSVPVSAFIDLGDHDLLSFTDVGEFRASTLDEWQVFTRPDACGGYATAEWTPLLELHGLSNDLLFCPNIVITPLGGEIRINVGTAGSEGSEANFYIGYWD